MFRSGLTAVSSRVLSTLGAGRRSYLSKFGALVFLALVAIPPALSLAVYQPITVDAPAHYGAGDTLPLDVTLTGGPENVTITSDPPGAVSYQGSVSSSQETVYASSDPSYTGSVTVYLETDGETTVYTTTTALSNADTDPGSGGTVGGGGG